MTSPLSEKLLQLQRARRDGLSLPQGFYTDTEVFEHDLTCIFQRRWHYAGHESQIARPGDYMLDDYGGDSIIITRGRDGSLSAMHNVCRHRGSRLCDEPCGNVKAIVCPYHAWTYALDGSLLAARAMHDGFDKTRHGLRPCHLRVLEGLIFICPGEPMADLEQPFADMRPFIVEHHLRNTRVAAIMSWPTAANWKLVVENFLECYHCAPTHPEYCSVMSHAMGDSTANPRQTEAFKALNESWSRSVAHDKVPTGTINRLDEAGYIVHRMPIGEGMLTQSRQGRPVAPLLGKRTQYDGGLIGAALRPTTHFYVCSDYAVVLSFVPRAADRTDTVVTWLVRDDAVEGRDYDVDELTWLWRVTTEQDKTIVERNHAGVAMRAYEPGPYSTLVEAGLPRFHRWYMQHWS